MADASRVSRAREDNGKNDGEDLMELEDGSLVPRNQVLMLDESHSKESSNEGSVSVPDLPTGTTVKMSGDKIISIQLPKSPASRKETDEIIQKIPVDPKVETIQAGEETKKKIIITNAPTKTPIRIQKIIPVNTTNLSPRVGRPPGPRVITMQKSPVVRPPTVVKVTRPTTNTSVVVRPVTSKSTGNARTMISLIDKSKIQLMQQKQKAVIVKMSSGNVQTVNSPPSPQRMVKVVSIASTSKSSSKAVSPVAQQTISTFRGVDQPIRLISPGISHIKQSADSISECSKRDEEFAIGQSEQSSVENVPEALVQETVAAHEETSASDLLAGQPILEDEVGGDTYQSDLFSSSVKDDDDDYTYTAPSLYAPPSSQILSDRVKSKGRKRGRRPGFSNKNNKRQEPKIEVDSGAGQSRAGRERRKSTKVMEMEEVLLSKKRRRATSKVDETEPFPPIHKLQEYSPNERVNVTEDLPDVEKDLESLEKIKSSNDFIEERHDKSDSIGKIQKKRQRKVNKDMKELNENFTKKRTDRIPKSNRRTRAATKTEENSSSSKTVFGSEDKEPEKNEEIESQKKSVDLTTLRSKSKRTAKTISEVKTKGRKVARNKSGVLESNTKGESKQKEETNSEKLKTARDRKKLVVKYDFGASARKNEAGLKFSQDNTEAESEVRRTRRTKK